RRRIRNRGTIAFMSVRWMLLALAAGCVHPSAVTCPGGELVCAADTVCANVRDPDETLCVTQDQIDACVGLADHVACHTDSFAIGRCYDGVCLPVVCGNGRIDRADPAVAGDLGEVCDDHNNTSGDGCSADCLSDETCGNGVLDGVRLEQCD